MFEKLSNFFNKMTKPEIKELASKDAAKERLHLVLMQDRANVSVDFLELMKKEIIDVIKKYIVVDENAIDVRLINQANEDGTNGAPSLFANIPIINIKNDVKAEKIKDGTLTQDDGLKNFQEEENIENNSDNNLENIVENKKENNLENDIDKINTYENLESNIENNSHEIIENKLDEYEEEQKSANLEVIELGEAEVASNNAISEESTMDYSEEEDDDDVTFDDLLKKAEEEESIKAEEISELKVNAIKGVNQKPIRSKKNRK